MWSILDLRLATFGDCCCLFTSSGTSGQDELCSIIERTWGTVIALEAADCYRASSLSRGIPKSPLAGGGVITSCNLSGNGSTWLNKVHGQEHFMNYMVDWICVVFSLQMNRFFACRMKFGLVTLCISNVSWLCVAFVDFWELQKLFFPFRLFFAAILIFVVLLPNEGTKDGVYLPLIYSLHLSEKLVHLQTPAPGTLITINQIFALLTWQPYFYLLCRDDCTNHTALYSVIVQASAVASANQTCFTVGNHIHKLLINKDLVTEYRGIANGSPFVVPSWDKSLRLPVWRASKGYYRY